MRFPVNHWRSRRNLPGVVPISLTLALALGAAGSAIASEHVQARALPAGVANGPAADFPVVIGAPFAVGQTTYTPADTMNFDAVGYADVGPAEGSAISAAHHTLPLPSYVEVTALESGRTVLVRVERRGPMTSNRLIQLSPAAAAQLGLADPDRSPVRVRRVNPPESERAQLRAGGMAPERMPTPKPLLAVLMRRLGPDVPVGLNAPSAASANAGRAPVATDMAQADPAPNAAAPRPLAASRFDKAFARSTITPRTEIAGEAGASFAPHGAAGPFAPVEKPRPAKLVAHPALAGASTHTEPVRAAPSGALVVQAGAFSARERAQSVASRIAGASVSAAGAMWRVRLGPFASRGEAEAALAKARSAGYSESRIQRND